MKICGKPRKYTDAQLAAIRSWKPLRVLCQELGIDPRAVPYLRRVEHKGPSPEKRQ